MPGSVDPLTSQNVTEQVFKQSISSRSDFVIIRKKLIHKAIENTTRPPFKSSLKMVCLRIGLEPDEWIKDSGCSKYMTKNKSLFSTDKANNREDLGSIIDSGLSEVVLGQPFAHTSKLTYDESLGLIRLYLMRRSLEVLRKFHWMILGGRFNQLSHVSSPLLSKPGEY
ncbi:hypothetical protein Tco_0849326 [Tanacetum coccineum]